MLDKNELDRLWLRLCDLQDYLLEERRMAMYWDTQTVMDHVDYLSRNLEEQQQQQQQQEEETK